MSAAKQAEKLEKHLKELLRLPDNKRCANCEAQGPQYAIIDFNIFVCTICSGVHRQFSHRCKGVSMATFKADEVKALEAAGNGVAEQVYLAKWRPTDLPRPVDRNPAKIKDWIDAVYQKKRFYSGEALSRVSTSSLQQTPSVRRMSSGSSDVVVMPMSSVLGGANFRLQVSPGPSGVPDSTSSAASSSRASVPPDNLLNFDGPMARPGGQHQQLVSILDESPSSAYGQPPAQQQPAFAGGWDAFGEAPTAPQAPAPTAAASPASGSAWADFGADPFGPPGGAASGVNGRVPEQQAGANGYGGQGAGTALPAGPAPAAGQPAAAQVPADSGGWQAFDAPQANGTVAGPGSAAVGQEQAASPAAGQQKQPEPPKRAELPLDLFGEMPPSMPHLGGGVQYGGPHGMMVPQQQLGMPRNGPVPPFPGAQAGFMAQQMFGGFGQPSLGPPSFAQAPQQQQVAGYGGMGGLGGGPFGATAPPQAYPSDEHPREQTAPDPFSGLVPGFRGALPRQQNPPAAPSAQPAWQSSQPARFGGGDRQSFSASGYSSSQPQPVSQTPSRQESFGSGQANQPLSNQAAGPKSGNPFA